MTWKNIQKFRRLLNASGEFSGKSFTSSIFIVYMLNFPCKNVFIYSVGINNRAALTRYIYVTLLNLTRIKNVKNCYILR